MNLKEKMVAKKLAKQANKLAANEKSRLEEIKKERDWKLTHDFISPIEFGCSTYKIFLDKVKKSLADNTITLDVLFEEMVQLHRFTFLETEYDFSNIRIIVEDLFTKYGSEFIDTATPEQLATKLNIHYKQRELLHKFCTVIYAKVASFTSRTVFATANLDMLTGHQAYCGITKPVLARFICREGVIDAQETIRQRVHQKDIYNAALAGKQITIDASGDYLFE